jgi:RHS repeat-associated protein
VDEPLARGGTEFYLSDAIGSTVALTDQDGAVATTYAYEPFGATADSTSSNPFQFTAREKEPVGGLYYYRARYYHPRLQRFIADDPAAFGGGNANLYAYVMANPLRFVDPLGLDVIVRRYCCHSPNRYGHIGLAIDDEPSRGFYPTEDRFKLILDARVPGRVVRDADLWRLDQLIETVRIPTTPDQDRAIRSFFDTLEREPGDYKLYGRNCSTQVQQALRSARIKVGFTTLPEETMQQIRKYIETISPQ